MSTNELAIGIDIGGTSVKSGVVYGGEIIDHAQKLKTPDFDGPAELVEALYQTINDLCDHHPGVRAVGIGMPGFINYEKGLVHYLTNVPGWKGFPLRARLEQRLEIPVTIDNDANCMAYAEWKRGAGRGIDNLIAITLGTGVGGGVIANGRIVRGSRFVAGEIGQMSSDWKGKSGHYGNLGALEEEIGNRQIPIRAREIYAEAGISKSLEELTPKHLSRLAHRGDEVALRVWDEIAQRLASVLMSCCWLLNPHAIIIGGGVARAGDVLFSPLTAHLYAQLSDPFRENLMVLAARFGDGAGIVGASTLALEEAGYAVGP